MKLNYAILVSLFFFSLSLRAQVEQQTNQSDSLTSLHISFESFLIDSTEDFELKASFAIIKRDGAFYGISNTALYCGIVKIPRWETPLTDTMISSLHDFLFHLRKTPYQVNVLGYQNDYYMAKFNGQHWYIKPDQSVLNNSRPEPSSSIDFPILAFYQEIFKTQIQDYIENRNTHRLAVDSLIKRKWYIAPDALTSLRQGSKLTFHSAPSAENTAFWYFEPDFSFSHSKQQSTDINSKIRIEYHAVKGLNSYMYLSIFNAKNHLEKEDDKIGMNHDSFYIIKLNHEELILQLAY